MATGKTIEMKRRLCTGLISPSSYLISVLDSIGVWYEEIDFEKNLFVNYSTLIYEGTELTTNKKNKILGFLNSGGGLLEISSDPVFFRCNTQKSFSKTIVNTHSQTEFDRIPYLDIYAEWTSSDNSQLFSGLIDFQKHKSELLSKGFIGLNLNSLPDSLNYIRKRFISSSKDFPDEIVNKVSRDSLNDIIELCLQKLIHEQQLPFLKKWTSPQLKPVFGFRIDSDYGSKQALKEIFILLSSKNILATWFLHVQEHESYLDIFKSFKNQELALHGYKHGYSSSNSKIKENIQLGLNKLEQAGIHPNGFCSPYGIWNFSLQQALTGFNFKYTSEFTTGYNCVPFFIPDTEHLQIPIHPVCTGSLSRKRYSSDQIRDYFLNIYDYKISLFKPVFFYHHPMQKGLNVFGEIFTKVKQDELTNLTFNEYADFWKKRQRQQISVYSEGSKIFIDSDNPDLFLYISNSHSKFDLIPSKSQILEKNSYSTFKYGTPSLPSIHEIEHTHGNRFQLFKTNFLDWRNRQRL